MKTQVFDYIGCQEYLIAMDDTNTWQKYWITMYFDMSNWLKLVKWVLDNNEWQNNLIIPQQKKTWPKAGRWKVKVWWGVYF